MTASSVSRIAICLIAVCFVAPIRADQESVRADQGIGLSKVDQAVARAIPFLQHEGAAWIEKRGCVSCHQIPLMLWSLRAAQEKGFDVDLAELRSRQAWSTQAVNFVKPEQKSDVDVEQTLAANIDTINGLLFAMPREQDVNSWRDRFTSALVSNQAADGTWKACGQLPAQKRPVNETGQVTVMWTLLALAQNEITDHVQGKALNGIVNDQPESTEWWVARLLLEDQLAGNVDELRARLLALQSDDGGWGWLSDESSDALATGMAIYALARTSASEAVGDDAESELSKAKEFLVATQRQDGSWSVPGTKKSARGRSTPTSDYWGTAWAVIGLLE